MCVEKGGTYIIDSSLHEGGEARVVDGQRRRAIVFKPWTHASIEVIVEALP